MVGRMEPEMHFLNGHPQTELALDGGSYLDQMRATGIVNSVRPGHNARLTHSFLAVTGLRPQSKVSGRPIDGSMIFRAPAAGWRDQ
jgi:hypothetical protein